MKRLIVLSLIILMHTGTRLAAQTLYVDATKGKTDGTGTLADPFPDLEKAVAVADNFTGTVPITIKIAPGLYLLPHKLVIQSLKKQADTAKYTFEAMVMPDDTGWQPTKMPVIESVADTNKGGPKFRFCVGFQVERNNVSFKGLKFTGNPRPGLAYYYVIERHNEQQKGLEISQCYFIGDKNLAPVQGCIFAEGEDITIDHCIFHGCKNAVLVFLNLKGFSLTHCIIFGAYEAAIWYGYGENSNFPFIFSNNIITNCNYFWVSEKDHEHHYHFSNSLIADNANYMGFNGMEIEGHDLKNVPVEVNIRKSGRVLLNDVTAKGIPHDYLNLSPASDGNDLHAGIFKK